MQQQGSDDEPAINEGSRQANRSVIRSAGILAPGLQVLLHLRQECVRAGTIQDAVVEDEGEVHHGTDRESVIAGRIGDDHNTLLNGTCPQDAALGLIDDRHGKERAADAVIGQREGAASNLIWQQLAGPRPVGEVIHRARKGQGARDGRRL